MQIGLRNYQKRILLIRIGILLAAIVALFLALSVFERFTIEREMASRRAAAEADYAALAAREVELRKKVDYLSRESSQEAEIRKHFDVAKEGETVVILQDPKTATTSPVVAPIAPEEPRWWQFWR